MDRAILTFMMLLLGPKTAHTLSHSVRPTVAVIGGGIAGLSCADKLSEMFDVTVFDTGRLRPGGRCSSRYPGDRAKETDLIHPFLSRYRIDHTAQAILVPPNQLFQAFNDQVKEWESRGVLRQFANESVYTFVGARRPVPLASENPLYYAADGMGTIALDMASNRQFNLQQDVWVSPSNGVRWIAKAQKWRVQAKGEVRGNFDYLIIAHNGKCADRLMSSSPAKEIHSLLRVNFAPSVSANGGNRMTLSSIYSLSLCLKSPSALLKALPGNFVAGFIEDNTDLGFLTCQSRKLAQDDTTNEVWTILSTPKFAKRHKAPQEFMPEETIEGVSALLLKSLEELLKMDPESSLSSDVVDRRLQLWGAAIPMNVWKGTDEGFLYDSTHRVAVCGDWLLDPSIAGAWTSGRKLAEFLVASKGGLQKNLGLDGKFTRSESSLGIGSELRKGIRA